MIDTISGRGNLLSSVEAGRRFGYTNDYVARLARKGKVRAVRVGREWLVDQESLAQFVIEAETAKREHAVRIREERKREFRASKQSRWRLIVQRAFPWRRGFVLVKGIFVAATGVLLGSCLFAAASSLDAPAAFARSMLFLKECAQAPSEDATPSCIRTFSITAAPESVAATAPIVAPTPSPIGADVGSAPPSAEKADIPPKAPTVAAVDSQKRGDPAPSISKGYSGLARTITYTANHRPEAAVTTRFSFGLPSLSLPVLPEIDVRAAVGTAFLKLTNGVRFAVRELWCEAASLFSDDACVDAPKLATLEPVVEEPPAPAPVYPTVAGDTNKVTNITNPTTIIREYHEVEVDRDRGDDDVPVVRFDGQVEQIYDDMQEGMSDLARNIDEDFGAIGESFSTDLLSVTGDTNLGGTLAVSGATTLNATLAVVGDTALTDLTVNRSTTTNATTTTLYAMTARGVDLAFANADFGSLVAGSLVASAATATDLSATRLIAGNATATDLSATRLIAGNATSTNLFATNFVAGAATATDFFTTRLSVDSLNLGSGITSHFVPSANDTYDLGSPSFYWRNGFIDTITTNSISAASTSIGGTNSETLTLNADNATGDLEDMSLIFYRGSVVPNAVITWNAATDRFEFNQPAHIANQSGLTTAPTLTLRGVAGQTGNLFQISSSTGQTVFAVAYDGAVSISTSTITALTSGTTTLSHLSVTNTSTSTFAGGLAVSGSSLFASAAVTGGLTVGGTATIGTLTGTLIGTNGVVSASTTLGAAFLDSGVLFASEIDTEGEFEAVVGGKDFLTVTTDDITAAELLSLVNGDTGTGNLVFSASPTFTGTMLASAATFSSTLTLSGSVANIALGSNWLSGDGGDEGINVNASGEVGIGTAAESGKRLRVTGDSRFLGSMFINGNGSHPILWMDQNSGPTTVKFNTDGDSYLTGGNLGIGTNSPTRLLTVGDGTGTRYISANGAGSGASAGSAYLLEQNGTLYGALGNASSVLGGAFDNDLVLYNASSTAMRFYTDANERMRIDASGTVGIGTTTPWGKLSVTNTGSGPSFVVEDATSPDTTPFIIAADGSVGIGTPSPAFGVDVRKDTIYQQGGHAELQFNQLDLNSGAEGGFYTGYNGQIAAQLTQNQGTGQVKIGGVAGGYFLSLFSGNAEAIRVLANGNVGIGTTSPASLLSIGNTGGINISTATSTFNTTGGIDLKNGGCFAIGGTCVGGSSITGTQGQVAYFSGTDTAMGTSSLFIAANGNVGIGSTSPSAALSVAGTIFANAILPNGPYTTNLASYDLGAAGRRWNALWAGTVNVGISTFSLSSNSASDLGFFNAASGGGTEVMTITQGGSVGIGIAAPTVTLDVNGSARIGGTLNVSGVINGSGNNTSMVNVGGVGSFRGTSGNTTTPLFAFGTETNLGIYRPTTGAIGFTSGGMERVRIDAAGNLGIGSTTPSARLTVADGDIHVGGIITSTSTSATSTIPWLSSTRLQVTGTIFDGTGTAGSSGMVMQSTGSGVAWVATSSLGIGGGSSLTGTTGQVAYLSGTDTAMGTSSLFIAANGNVGIGTTSPNASLAVTGNIVLTDRIFADVNNSETSQAQLAIFQRGSGDAFLQFSTPANGGWAVGNDNSDSHKFKIGVSGGGVATLENTTVLTITKDRLVGIGTTSPFATLSVQGVNGISGSAPTAFAVFGGTGAAVASAEGGPIILQGGLGGGDAGFSPGIGGKVQIFGGRGGDGDFGAAGGLAEIYGGNGGGGGDFDGGNGGSIYISGGAGGGAGGTPGTVGNVFLGVTSAGSMRGNVGIGVAATSTMAYKLEIAGTGAGTQDLMRLRNLQTAANNTGTQMLFAANRTTSGLTNIAGVSGIITDITQSAYKGALVFSTSNNAAPAERMRIDNTGNVGIGTTDTTLGRLAVSFADPPQTWAPVGSDLAISGADFPVLATLSPNRVAYFDNTNDSLRTYEFNGSTWALVGSGLTISTAADPALAALSPNRVAFFDTTNDSLRVYEFNGSTWALVGSGLTISATGAPALAALSPNRVAYIDASNDSLRTYEFNGSTWALVGSGLSVSAADPTLVTLSPDRVALDAFGFLRTYEFNGSTWALVGSGLTISGASDPALAALSPNRVAYIDANNESLRTYQWSTPLLNIAGTDDYAYLSVSDAGYTTAESMGVRSLLTVGQSATSTATLSAPAFVVNGTSVFSSGVGIGSTTPSGQLGIVQPVDSVAGGLWIAATDGDSRAMWMNTSQVMNFTGGSGNTATLNAVGAWGNASDIAYKENIADLEYGLSEIMAMVPRRYTWKSTGATDIGFIAQELDDLIPEVVSGEDGSKTISYGQLSAIAINALKEIGQRIDLVSSPTSAPALTLDAAGDVIVNRNLFVDSDASLSALMVSGGSKFGSGIAVGGGMSSFDGAVSFGDRISFATSTEVTASGISAPTGFSINDSAFSMNALGSIGIGTSTPTAQLSTTGTVRFSNFGAGTLQTDANGNVSVSSDERLKRIEGEFTKGLEAVLALEPINFTWKDSTGFDTANVYTGFSAQNVQLAIPEAVGEDRRGFLTLSERPILAAVVNAVKELYGTVRVVQDTVMGFADRFTTNELCVGSTCITESELKAILEERDIEAVDPSGGNSGDNMPEPDGEIGSPPSQDDGDAAQEGIEAPSDPSAESSSHSEEATVAEASVPPAEDLAGEPNTPAEPSDEAPSSTETESTSPN